MRLSNDDNRANIFLIGGAYLTTTAAVSWALGWNRKTAALAAANLATGALHCQVENSCISQGKRPYSILRIERNTFSWRTLGLTVQLFGGAWVFAQCVDFAFRNHTSLDTMALKVVQAKSPRSRLSTFAVMAVAIPICEEVLIRQHLVTAEFRDPIDVASSTFFFGLMHCWPAPNLATSANKVLQTTALGLACGIVAYESESLLPAIAMHMTWNALHCLGGWRMLPLT